MKNTIAVAIVSAGLLCSQAPPPVAPAKPDSDAVKALIEKAKKVGGPRWADEEHFFCEAPRPNSPSDPPIEPTKIFDNVYAIGNQGTVAYVIQTSAGLVMIDALSPDQTETQLLPGFQKLGLDPAMVKIIVVGHGHADHFGGSAYFQEHFGSKIYIAEADWQMMANAASRASKGPLAPLPKHDQVLTEGQPVVLGDFKLTPVAVPGHTPGSMGFIFPVKDRGKTYVAAMYAGTVLTPGIVSDEGLQTYAKSVVHFEELTKKAKVEVELQNHPLMDPIQPKLDKLKTRKPAEPNPFFVGRADYQKFLGVMGACTEVNIARRKGL
ncbi:MAG TPA: MBL fold metallo-hydrolase [Bryobacteraceae bacterium]|nr:MBL fold metallo-hydrolase [Bryobacteraceae bacterium]